LLYRANRSGDVFKTQFAYEFSRPGISRARLRAGCVMTKQTTIRFGNRLGQVKPFAHMLKFFSSAHNYSSFVPWYFA
jgi:hypothetical protein